MDNVSKSCMNDVYSSNERIAYLTFDDGPVKRITPKILDILDEFGIKATFFIIGKRAEQYPEIIKRIYESGHLLANHTYSHDNATIYKTKESFLNEIKKTDSIIGNILNIPDYSCKIFRFPNGSTARAFYKEKQKAMTYLEEINYSYIDWNCVNDDAIRKCSKEQLVNNLINSAKNKNTLVVLMHDSGDVNNTYDALEDSILFLLSQGYIFKTLAI